ncbi:MAG: DUF3160 domain-containing protein [Planctomycetaceae bacterium]
MIAACSSLIFQEEPASDQPETWRQHAKLMGLNDADIEALHKDDLLVTQESFHQYSDAYQFQGIPMFITSDSMLAAYHSLLQETLIQVEARQAGHLSEILATIRERLEKHQVIVKDEEFLTNAANTRARLVIGIAERLLRPEIRTDDPKLDLLIGEECTRIESAEGSYLPDWLGPPSAHLLTIHYDRFKPRSFYTRNPLLERYFRAISWLQAIPFRMDNNEELLSAIMLGHAMSVEAAGDPDGMESESEFPHLSWEERQEQDRRESIFRYAHELVGKPDTLDIVDAAEAWEFIVDGDRRLRDLARPTAPSETSRTYSITSTQLSEQRQSLISRASFVINDHDRLMADSQAELRIVAASQTPTAILFQKTMDATAEKRDLPHGLEVVIALESHRNWLRAMEDREKELEKLGDAAADADMPPVRMTPTDVSGARQFLSTPEKDRVLGVVDAASENFVSYNLVGHWLHALDSLIDEPDSDAPAFMKKVSWKRKSCNTVLTSWTQLNHAVTLHAKVAGGFGGGPEPPPAFVEPDPEFFSRLATLGDSTRSVIYSSGNLDPAAPDYRPLIPILRSLEAFAADTADRKWMAYKILEHEDLENYCHNRALTILELVSAEEQPRGTMEEQWKRAVEREFSEEFLVSIRSFADDVKSSKECDRKLEEVRDEMSWEILFKLAALTGKYPDDSLSWRDRWGQVTNRALPKVQKRLLQLSEGALNAADIQKNIQKIYPYHDIISERDAIRLIFEVSKSTQGNDANFGEQWQRTVRTLIEQCEKDQSEKHPALVASMNPGFDDHRERWNLFVETSRRLEALAHKQLRGAPLTRDERWYMRSFGDVLADLNVKGNFGHPDDMPCIATVYTNNVNDRRLQAAVSRPQAIFVLYPWHGDTILTKGAVQTYREFSSDTNLTDEQWRELLDSPEVPPLPDWLAPIVSGTKPPME